MEKKCSRVNEMDIVFWGAGRFWDDHVEELKQLRDYSSDNWLCICDKDEKKRGRENLGVRVCEPRKINEALYVITSVHVDEIRKELIENFGISGNEIVSFFEYCRMAYAKNKYGVRYKEDSTKREIFIKSNLVVYTCITGDYDVLRDPVDYDPNLNYICFTNNRNMHSNTWNIQYISDHGLDNIHLARYVKLFPHVFLKEYDTSIWVDGKYQIKADLKEYVAEYEKTKSMLCFPHPQRDCIYDEAIACKLVKKGIPEDIDRQIDEYRKMKYPAENGLYETGCIVRNHQDEMVRTIMNDWWREITKYSYRDQISLPYILWKYDYLPDICDLDINENRWLRMVRWELQ